VKLSEALKASKKRKAFAIVYTENSPVHLSASDAGVIIITKDGYTERTWIDLLPKDHELIMSASWEPQDPRPPLQQLADTLTDWSDD
jgi:hypothetical protein